MKRVWNGLLGTLLVLLLVGTPALASSLAGIGLNPIEDLGHQITAYSVKTSAVYNEQGKNLLYAAVAGTPAVFSVVDLDNYKLVEYFYLDRVHDIWMIDVDASGVVYMGATVDGGDAELWFYDAKNYASPESLGVVHPGEKSIWAITVDELGRVYLGTFPTGRVVSFDPRTKSFRDYGPMIDGEQYVRSIGYHEGKVFAGTGSTGYVVELDVHSGTKKIISDPVYDLLGETELPFCYDMAIVDGYVMARFAGSLNTIVFYDIENETWMPHVFPKAQGFLNLATKDGKVYPAIEGEITAIDLTDFTATKTGAKFGSIVRGGHWVERNGSEKYVTARWFGDLAFCDLETGEVEIPAPVVQPASNPLHHIAYGLGGSVFMGGYPGGQIAEYNVFTGETVNFEGGQPEAMVAYKDEAVFFGVYPGAHIYRLDNVQPRKLEKVFTVGHGQDRPYYMDIVGDDLIIGTIPDYGVLGGSIVIHNIPSGETEVYVNPVEDHSVISLVDLGDYLLGGTTIHGGLGITPTSKKGRLFLWDKATKQTVRDWELDLPELDNPPMISALSKGPDGLIWGIADGIVFALDPQTFEVAKYVNVYPEITNYGFWRPRQIKWSKDGLMYANPGSKLTVLDPRTLEFKTLYEIKDHYGADVVIELAVDEQGEEAVYFLAEDARSSLFRLKLGK